MKKCGILGLIGMLCLLTACSHLPEGKQFSFGKIFDWNKLTARGQESMEPEPDLSYEVPKVIPGVLVNQTGYLKNSKKAAVFQGKDLPSEFYVIDNSTDAVVYTGRLEQKGYNSTTREYTSYGEFTELTAEGEYYIQCDIIGRSYSFQIGEGVYDRCFTDSLKQLALTENQSVEEICRMSAALLLSYELYGESYTQDGILEDGGNGIPDILDILKEKMLWLLQIQEEETFGEDKKTAAYACAVLAKFSYLYQTYDTNLATRCLQAADKEWRMLEQEQTKQEEIQAICFFAGAELYRASGQYEYRNGVEKYLLTKDDTWKIQREEFYGGMTYISTNRKVNMDLCHIFMDCFMKKMEQIIKDSAGIQYLSDENWQQCTTEELLWNAVLLSVADYIMSSNEYAKVIENYQHYFLGRNREAVCYLAEEGCRRIVSVQESIWEHAVWNAYYLCMLGEIVSQ